MNALIRTASAVTLVGGGPVQKSEIDAALAHAPVLVAADGGAGPAVEAGHMPLAVIGDFDSLEPGVRAAIPADRLHRVEEQDSTDFHKCLARIEAPLILAVGFAAGRMDHLLAVFNVMARLPKRRALVIGPEDVCLLAPPQLAIDLEPGTPVSLFPMGAVTAESRGLEWPLDGLSFAPDGQSATSNRAEGHVLLAPHAPKLLLMLPHRALPRLLDALGDAPGW
ncbi:thiamine diphosphokinase [Mangrovicoccus ximenensis]|uniref:thiamine diphosphokinase n=1 Tax=Mangrovicoccus ximenensis TaxID=1911570 RepID=UPI001F029C8E|nr:thiamine diphosphokinase [Mangrovicoccus ximenensis]